MAAVYHDYDQAALDDQYTGRSRIPDYDTYLERWPRTSAAVRARLPHVGDVAYGDDPRETYDVFPPAAAATAAGAPVHVFFHGGYWQSQDKTDFTFTAPTFVDRGALFINANYPLCTDVTMARLVQACRAATAHAWRNARRWGGDPGRLTVAGHSAGGHIVAALVATDWPATAADLPPDMIKAGLAISGLYDLEPIRLSYANDTLRLGAALARAASPIHHLPAAVGAMTLAVGSGESEEFHRQQAAFAAAWRAAGLACETLALPGLNHFSILDDYAAADGKLAGVALDQLGLRPEARAGPRPSTSSGRGPHAELVEAGGPSVRTLRIWTMTDDTFTLHDLKVEWIAGDKPCWCGAKAGDHFILKGEHLHFPPGQTWSIYQLATVLPFLAAKQRPTHANDWMTTDAEFACSDPNCGARFRITRQGQTTFSHAETTAVPLPDADTE